MKRIILHIGTEKTGTSTIQRFFHINAKALATSGIVYPTVAYGPDMLSHVGLPVFAAGEKRLGSDIHAKFGVSDASALERFRDQLRARLYDAAAVSDYHTMVFSSEHLSSRLTEPAELARLKTLLEPLGTIDVILYVRPQEELVASSYSTSIRLGATQAFSDYIEKSIQLKYYNYRFLCQLWSEAFGREHMRVRIFSTAAFHDGDLLSDIVRTAGLPINMADYVPPPRENESLSRLNLEFIRQLNVHLPRLGAKPALNPDPRWDVLQHIISQLNNTGNTGKVRVGAATALKLRQHFGPGNARVAREYFGKPAGGLFTLRQPTAAELAAADADPELSLSKAFELFAEIWGRAMARRIGQQVSP